jgi:lantibiotic modifying enzyme
MSFGVVPSASAGGASPADRPGPHARDLSRRGFVHLGCVGGGVLGIHSLGLGSTLRLPFLGGSDAGSAAGSAAPIDVARAAARWIGEHRRETAHGVTWPRVPGDDAGGDLSLYHGSPGVVLFLLELHAQTGDEAALAEAARGADELIGVLDSDVPVPPGLYTGLAGMWTALDRTAVATGAARYAAGAETCIRRVVETARQVPSGRMWFDDALPDASSDIVSGAAGIGLALLAAHARDGGEDALRVAHEVARYLVTIGEPQDGGPMWRISPSFPRNYPNFSHGTGGVAYFLARTARATGDGDLLAAAVEGGTYLRHVSDCGADGCLVFHHEPDGEELYYLSWCHGPAGTARLYHELADATGDTAWSDLVLSGAAATRGQGVPDTRTPGYWNNISQCCGDAGVGEFFLALHALTGDDGHLAYARHVADWIAGRADEPDAPVRKWTQAEHRVQPDMLQAQTGWMQGAAGVGAFFLHLAAREAGRSPFVVLPDSPWGSVL